MERIEDALRGLGEDAESTDLRLMLTNNRLTYLAVLGRWREAEAALPAALMLPERAGTFRAAGLVATAAEISISAHARDLAASGKFDADKVEALKTQIAEGKFKINSQDVARRMLEALG